MFRRPCLMRLFSGLALWASAASLTGASRTDGPLEARYRVRHWTTGDGLPQNSVRALAQTPDGYIWAGTLFGLARFDGVRFTVFDANNTPAFASDAVNALAVDARDGSLWIGTGKGVVRFADGRFERFGVEYGIGGVWMLATSGGGGVWLTARRGEVKRIRAGQVDTWRFATDAQTNEVRRLHEAGDSALFAGLSDRLGRLELSITNTMQFTQLTRPGWELKSFATDDAGRFWISGAGGVMEWQAGRGRMLATADGANNNRAGDLVYRSAQGDLWFKLGARGLHRLDEATGALAPLGEDGVALDRGLSSVLRDVEGSLWMGTEFGLYQLTPHRVRMFTRADGLRDDDVRTACAGPDGTVWLGTKGGVSFIRAGQAGNLAPPSRDPEGASELVVLRDGTVWLGEYGRLTWRDGAFHPIFWTWHPGDGGASALLEDRRGRLWVGRDKRVECHEGESVEVYDTRHGLPGFKVCGALEDHSGGLWFGTYGGGLAKLEGGRFSTFATTHGELNNRMWAIHEDADGVFWIGTQAGLNRFVPPEVPIDPGHSVPGTERETDGLVARRFFTFTTAHGLHENVVNHVLEDEFGFLWFGGLKGIYRIARAELNAVAAGRTNHLRCVALGEADGMLTPETHGEHTPAACKTPDGRLWFPTGRGVVVVDPKEIEQQERDTPLPQVVIEEVAADGEVFAGVARPAPLRSAAALDGRAPDAPLKLAAGRARVLEMRYTANCFTAPERVRFRYRLTRDEDAATWTEAGDRRVAYFTNLRPGAYRFQVAAADHHGRWNESGASVAFSLEPHFYESWLFYALCGAGVISAAAGFSAYRVRWQGRLLSAQHVQALAEERARIARDLHDDLGTALTGVALELDLTRRQSRDGVAARLGESAARVRSLAERMREVVWAVNPQCDTVSSLASFLEQQAGALLRGAGAVRGRFEFPENIPALPLDSETRHQLALGVREALTNAVRHAEATEVRVTLELQRATLVVGVADNGRGFDAATAGADPGHGLENLRLRIGRVGGTVKVVSSPRAGTRVEFRVPLEKNGGNGGPA